MDSNHRYRMRTTLFGCPRSVPQFAFRNKNRLFRAGDRWFESISLQRRVRCEPEDHHIDIPVPPGSTRAHTATDRLCNFGQTESKTPEQQRQTPQQRSQKAPRRQGQVGHMFKVG